MSRRDAGMFLQDIVDRSDYLMALSGRLSFAAFEGSDTEVYAAELCFMVIGEALNQLKRLDPAIAARITDITQAVALRNLIAHVYWHIDRMTLWQIITTRVPAFREQVAKELAALTPPS